VVQFGRLIICLD